MADVVLTVPIEGKVVIPGGKSPANYQVILNNEYYALVAMDGSFIFHGIPSGKLATLFLSPL
jgi:hypothetical protein